MADVIKVLGQSSPAASTPTELYVVPAATMTTVSSLVVCERAGGTPTFRVWVRVEGAGTEDKQYLYFDKPLATKETIAIVLGMTLKETDEVYVQSSDGNVSFNLFGVETS